MNTITKNIPVISRFVKTINRIDIMQIEMAVILFIRYGIAPSLISSNRVFFSLIGFISWLKFNFEKIEVSISLFSLFLSKFMSGMDRVVKKLIKCSADPPIHMKNLSKMVSPV